MQNTDFKPRVDYELHRGLEERVKSYLDERGYFVYESTYHKVLPDMLAKLLSRRFSMTALYLRGRADCIAMHKVIPIEFEWEAKTHANPRYNDLTIELLPLAHHISKAALGVRCLYVFSVNGLEGGFWAHELPPVRSVHLPPRQEYKSIIWNFENMAAKYFSDAPVNRNPSGGSGDPYVIFDKSVIREQKRWQDLIDEVTK